MNCSGRLVYRARMSRGSVLAEAARRVVREERDRRGLTRQVLADAVLATLPDAVLQERGSPVVSDHTILKLETGRPVELHRLRPVLVYLGLRAVPRTSGPADGEHPGTWLKNLRTSNGISPRLFCENAHLPDRQNALSRTTLNRIEACAQPRCFVFRLLQEGFASFGLELDTNMLYRVYDSKLLRRDVATAGHAVAEATRQSPVKLAAARAAPRIMGAGLALEKLPERLVAGAETAFIDPVALGEEIRRFEALRRNAPPVG